MNNLIGKLVRDTGVGILASDESSTTLTGRFAEFGLPPPNHETKRAYREVLYSAPGIEQWLGAIILFDDMLDEATGLGTKFVDLLKDRGVLVGVTADQGRVAIAESSKERITLGRSDLPARLSEYREKGVDFCKWRAEFRIGDGTPSERLIVRNAEDLAAFAAACQHAKLVPLVEPDLIMEGAHDLAECRRTTLLVLDRTFDSFVSAGVDLSGVVLKLHMITPGSHRGPASPSEVAAATLLVLSRAVPASLPLVVFLSGGQSEANTNTNLAAISKASLDAGLPQRISYSFGRSLQRAALSAWRGLPENVPAAHAAFVASLRAASAAARGGVLECASV